MTFPLFTARIDFKFAATSPLEKRMFLSSSLFLLYQKFTVIIKYYVSHFISKLYNAAD